MPFFFFCISICCLAKHFNLFSVYCDVLLLVVHTYIHTLLLLFFAFSNPIPNPSATETPSASLPYSRCLQSRWPIRRQKETLRTSPDHKSCLRIFVSFCFSFFLIRLLAILQPCCVCFCAVFDSDSCFFLLHIFFLVKIDISTTRSFLLNCGCLLVRFGFLPF